MMNKDSFQALAQIINHAKKLRDTLPKDIKAAKAKLSPEEKAAYDGVMKDLNIEKALKDFDKALKMQEATIRKKAR